MLEQLFGSQTRVKLLFLFLGNPEKAFFVREITRKISSQINSVRREIERLADLGIIKIVEGPEEESGKGKAKIKKYYQIDAEFILYPEIKALFLKSQLLLERNFITKLKNFGTVKLLLLTGQFLGQSDSNSDLLLVGSVNKKKFSQLMNQFEKQLGHEINYTLMNYPEYKYRRDVTDRFLYSILDNKKIVVIDKTSWSETSKNDE